MSYYSRTLTTIPMNSNRAIAAMLHEFQSYQPYDELEAHHKSQLIHLIETNADPLDANCFEPGHATGSVWIFDPEKQQVAMVFHKKMKRWLQAGGHADFDEPNLKVAALREAQEEVGLQLDVDQAILFDLDVHLIPAGHYPEHLHYDVRYLCLCPVQLLTPESKDTPAQWFDIEDLASWPPDPGLDRMLQKTIAWSTN